MIFENILWHESGVNCLAKKPEVENLVCRVYLKESVTFIKCGA
jgi:hypothetical protein